MIKRLLKIPKFIVFFIYAKLSPVSFAKYIGVRITGKIFIYGSSFDMFSAEPYLISLGNNVHITKHVQFIPHDGGTLILRHIEPTLEKANQIHVSDNVFIGVCSIILPGVTIGKNSIIAAGSVVAKSVPENSVYGGNPAKFICSIDTYFEKVKENSLGFGDLYGHEKELAYKRYFEIK